jgi:hypothetical protein
MTNNDDYEWPKIISVINNNSSNNCVNICIYSDSQSALSAINQINNSHPIEHEIKTTRIVLFRCLLPIILSYKTHICSKQGT